MSDLSLNPSSWTLGNLAEGLSDAVGLPEVVGDILGGGVSLMTGDFGGAIDQASDFGENVVAGAQAAYQAGKDAFLHGPGGCSSPNQAEAPSGGYGAGQANGPEDTGMPTTGGGSLEDQIFAMLLKLQTKQQERVLAKGTQMQGKAEAAEKADKARSDAAAGGGTPGTPAEAPAPGGSVMDQGDSQQLTKMSNDLKALQDLTTNLLAMFHDAKKNSIQNIR